MTPLLARWLERLDRWIALHPVTGSTAARQLGEELEHELTGLGFGVERWPGLEGDLLIARAGPAAGRVLAMYGHTDVVAGGTTRTVVRDGRVHGRGVADNLGPLALRLEVLRERGVQGPLIWVIEPGEETGSRTLATWLEHTGGVAADLWLDETGYFTATGDQRLLAVHADDTLVALIDALAAVARAGARGVHHERRRLNRVTDDAVPVVERLFGARPYLAIGPNDDGCGVHEVVESLALANAELAAQQFAELLARSAERAS